MGGMIRRGFLSAVERKELLSLARDGSAEHRLARRANAILLLDDGLSCEQVAKVLYLDDDTVRGWRKLYGERGIAGLERFDAGGSSSRLATAQEETLKAYVAQALPRSTREIGAFIEREFGVFYESRAGLIALLHRLGLNTTNRKSSAAGSIRKNSRPSSKVTRSCGTRLALTRRCCSWTQCIRPMPHGRLAAGRPRKKSWQSSRQAGASVSIFTAPLTLRQGKPA